MIPIDLSNKVAVITGGSGALGRVMVRTLAEAGADIAICYYRDEKTAHYLCNVEALPKKLPTQCFSSPRI